MRLDDAIGLLQQLVDVDPHPFLVVSLCDLYAEQEAWDEIVDVAAGTSNDDDVSLQVRIYQAQAFEAQGMKDAALEAYKDALKSKKRDTDLLKEARYARGRLYLEMGKNAQGRKELERVYAENPKFRDVSELCKHRAEPGAGGQRRPVRFTPRRRSRPGSAARRAPVLNAREPYGTA